MARQGTLVAQMTHVSELLRETSSQHHLRAALPVLFACEEGWEEAEVSCNLCWPGYVPAPALSWCINCSW